MAESYWLAEPAEPLARVLRDGRPDAVVIGGGVTGCSCALTLAEAGLGVRLFEARRVAWGASGRNGGFALRGLAISYPEARNRFGTETAAALWRFTERSLDRMAELAGDALRRVGSLRLADNEELEAIRAEYEALRADGIAAKWVDDLPAPLAAIFRGAILHPGDASLQPARWVRRLAARAAAAGAEIVEKTRVESLDELDADHVVIATDGYTHGLLPQLDRAIQPVRGQVIVTEPLTTTLYPRPHYSRYGFDYWQQTPDGRLVLGGRRDKNLEAEFTNEEELTDPIQNELETFAAELIGEEPRIEHRWPGIFGSTEDSLPLVGRVPGRDGVWVSAGYSGHGNVMGLACGELVAQAILGSPAPELQYLDPARLL
jgi:gamma-glutamylputrescine oxidase